MKILLDECIPRKFKNSFSGHDCRTVAEEGLSGQKNGEHLRRAETAGFEVFVTLDRGMEYEQNLRTLKITIIFLRSISNRLQDFLPNIPEIEAALESRPKGGILKVG